MVKALAAYVAGILLGKMLDGAIPPLWALIGVGIGCSVYVIWSSLNRFSKNKAFAICFPFLVFCYGYYALVSHCPRYVDNHISKYLHLTQYVGIIEDEPIIKEKTIRFPVRVVAGIDALQSYSLSGKIMVSLLRDSGTTALYGYGDEIALINKLKEVPPPFNPKEFDYKAYLKNKGMELQALLLPREIKVIDHQKGNVFVAYSLSLRKALIAKFRKYLKDDEAFQVAVALIFGYRSLIDPQTISAFTDTGTIHVLSVSGLHVSLVFVCLNFVLQWLDRWRWGKTVKSCIILSFIWAYVMLTGMSPPILRAGIMISFFVMSQLLNRKQVSVNTLAASALIILIFSPNYLFDVGFQLSYAAMLGILLGYPLFRAYYLSGNKWINYLLDYLYVCIAAQLFTLPLSLYYFGQFPNYFLLANLFIALPSTIIMYIGVFLSILPFDSLNVVLGRILEFSLIFMMEGLKRIASLPSSLIQGVEWSGIQVLLFIVAMAALVVGLDRRSGRALLLSIMSIFGVCVISAFASIRKTKDSFIIIYNVRSDVAAALVRPSQVVLYSTLDSLNHPTLRYSVLPSLKPYISSSQIEFHKIENVLRHGFLLEWGTYRLLLLEDRVDEANLPPDVNLILWRKNNGNDVLQLLSRYPKAQLVVDGSNSDRHIRALQDRIPNSELLYVLKNNFAYVWDGLQL